MVKSIRVEQKVGHGDVSRVVAVGLDLSDKTASFYAIDEDGECVERGTVALRREVVEQWAKRYPRTLIALEAGTHSPWISRTLARVGHEGVVAHPAKVPLITKNQRKSDRVDPELLARLARFERKLLCEITHRSEEAQRDLQTIRSREVAVGARTKMIGHVRGTVKAYGLRIPKCSTVSFVRKAREVLEDSMNEMLQPMFAMIEQLSEMIATYDRKVEALVETKYPEAKQLMQIRGVGALTALAYVLVLEDPHRFASSRVAGAYVGLVPARDQSGNADPQLRITRAGDRLLRRLLVQSAQYILGPFGVDCDLRRHGEAIASRGGKNAKKRAAVAVARKLAVLLHRLWVSGEVYDPLHNANRQQMEMAARATAAFGPHACVPPSSV